MKIDLANCDLRNLKLQGLDLRGFDFTGCLFDNTDLTGAKLEGAIFIGADLRGAILTDTILEKKMTDAVITQIVQDKRPWGVGHLVKLRGQMDEQKAAYDSLPDRPDDDDDPNLDSRGSVPALVLRDLAKLKLWNAYAKTRKEYEHELNKHIKQEKQNDQS